MPVRTRTASKRTPNELNVPLLIHDTSGWAGCWKKQSTRYITASSTIAPTPCQKTGIGLRIMPNARDEVRRGKGVRISGGLAHSYYVGVQTGPTPADTSALCVLPAGVEEGQSVDLTDRPVWILEGPSITNTGYRVVAGPVQAEMRP